MSQQPGGPSWQLPAAPARPPRRGPHPPGERGSFRRAVLFTVAGTAVPGLGLIAARRRLLGGLIVAAFATTLIVFAVWAAVDLEGLVSLAVRPRVLQAAAVMLIIAGLGWVGVVVASHLSLRPEPTRAQRVTGGLLVGALSFVVAAPLAVGARYSYQQAGLVNQVFRSEKETKSATRPTLAPPPRATNGEDTQPPDPWANKPRLNLLLLGGDAGRGRIGTRTDTVIVASIDTRTGNTTLFSLPRNTARMPFPARSPLARYYPYGFTNGDGNNAEYFLNAMYDNLPRTVPPDVLGETDNLGADALKLSVGAALGLRIDYFVLVNLKGFEELVNALGGIRVNVNTYIPIGGNTDLRIPPKDYISPGRNKKLNGREALWFARGRYGSDDFARMDRQRCVIDAIIRQANPTTMLTRYEKIAKAGRDIVITDLPQEVLPMMVDLSLRVKDGTARSVVFRHGQAGFYSTYPDFDLMRQRVRNAIKESKAAKSPGESTSRPRKSPSPTPTSASEDIGDSCAWQPEVAATAQPAR